MQDFNHIDFLAVQLLKREENISTLKAKEKYILLPDYKKVFYTSRVSLIFNITITPPWI